ncbi:MAG: xanthine dehydrogenase family protein molybdopterin-binding subunit [Acidimicrobiia bacterium]
MTFETAIPSFLGAPVQRREDPALITGTARYVDDIAPSGTLHLALVRSPFPHATVTGIDIDAALEVEGVHLILTPEDVADISMPPEPNPERNIPRRYPLVQGRALMPGDPVAAVVADTPEAARDAADLVFVDYEPLPVVGDVDQGIAAQPIHPDQASNVAYDRSRGDREEFDSLTGPIRLSGMVDSPRVAPAPMEPRAVLAEWKEGGLTVHLSSQAPQLMQEELAKSFQLPQSSIRVITPFVGGGFGCKFDLAEEEYLAVIGARRTGRPVKWIETRREHLLTIGHGRAQRHRWEVVADNDGRIQGLWVDSRLDLGCRHRYLGFIDVTPRIATGNYDIPVYGWRQRGVWTNRAPRGIYRGAGRPEATLTIERVIEAVSRATGIDPAEVRRRNFVQPDQFPYKSKGGYTFDSGDYEKTLDRLLEVADYRGLRQMQESARAAGRLVGLGLSAYVEVCGFEDWGAARVQVHMDGSVSLYVETLDQGQGHRTSFPQLVAGSLGIPVEKIRLEQGDTISAPYGWGTSGSRSLAQGGSASYTAAEKVAEKARRVAAHLLEASAEDIVLGGGEARVTGTDVAVKWEAIAEAALNGNVPEGEDPGFDEEVFLRSGGLNFPYGIHLAVVEVDPETGAPQVLSMWAVDDAGIIVNPMLAEGQRHGGLAQGIGQALWEEVVYDGDGNLVTSSFMDYLIPAANTLPMFDLDGTVTPTPTNPLGAKGIGEAGAIGATPAIVNAVCDALDIDEIQMPLTAQKVWAALQTV